MVPEAPRLRPLWCRPHVRHCAAGDLRLRLRRVSQPCRYHGAERIFGEAAQNLGRCSAAQHVATPASVLQRRTACCNATDHLAAPLSLLQPSTACCNTVLNPPAGSRGNTSTTALTVSVVSGGKSAPRCRTSRRYSGGSTARTPRSVLPLVPLSRSHLEGRGPTWAGRSRCKRERARVIMLYHR